ncbi:MAG: acyl--CoA ligase, partial [Synergistaceae bacterium]|nr:acyl--CoA ligase [Synergistaceae bacterium]
MDFTEQKYYDILQEQASKHPDKPAVVMGEKCLTYSEFVGKIDNVSSFLVEHGVNSGDRVVLWSSPCPEWLYVYYGIVHVGAVAVCLNSNYTVDDVTPLVTFADSKYALYGTTHDTKGVASEAKTLSQSFGLPEDSVFSIFETDFASVAVSEITDTRDVHDDAYIIYTSGTTAFPKAVLTSQYSMINTSLKFADEFKSIRGDKACVALPLFHAFGLSVPCVYLFLGGTVYIPEKVKAQDIADIVNREHITDLWSVAAVYQSIIDSKEYTDKCAPFIKVCSIAGSYTSPMQFTRFEAALNHATFLNMFGMTETATVFIMARPEDSIQVRYNTIGRKIPDVEIGICDAERGMLPAGEVGELVTRGFHIKNGYYKLPPEKQSVDADGWFHTGDLGVMDDDGNVRIMGRIKDIIIKGGENITPSEIEAEALNDSSIKECRIFGYKDRLYGENLGACVILQPGATFDEATTRKHLRDKLGSFKVPAYFFLYDKFPLNATGKVDQRTLHVDMLKRLRKMELDGELEKGVSVLDVGIKNTSYAIIPLVSMVENYALAFGFKPKQAGRIRLACEEMLTERILNAFEDV